uniref:Uncharacterized protein n=1 Tax=Grammatophora oceanica TaxID=210454 RepID=A0A7S1VBE5_9STRA|mmetsp:Transcript_40609/g.60219  ORF Transcript_40609/g.60219 Transcript_40609/m.60219 type:complete len:106 (+) Transcript_40609:1528-1845(+)
MPTPNLVDTKSLFEIRYQTIACLFLFRSPADAVSSNFAFSEYVSQNFQNCNRSKKKQRRQRTVMTVDTFLTRSLMNHAQVPAGEAVYHKVTLRRKQASNQSHYDL